MENTCLTPYEIILSKRGGKELTENQITAMVMGFTSGKIPQYQFSSFLMAVYFRGMTGRETCFLTKCMMNSGEILDLSFLKKKTVDKHSTGGVGDKVSIILAPIAAAGGVPVPMMSGRGLGHTGGTLDKLESIPGFKTNLTKKTFFRLLKKSNIAMIGQTDKIAPADKKMYALRDVTATVESIPLIASSIMSKKLAEGTDCLILDVKTGTGAFMRKMKDAETLARLLVNIAKKMGKKVTALITDMNQPLGTAVGNSLEIKECIETLKNSGPEDLTKLCVELAGYMFAISGKTKNKGSGRGLAKKLLANGTALKKFREMVKNQGGNIDSTEDTSLLPKTKYNKKVLSPKTGFIKSINALEVGLTAVFIGAGREKLDASIDHGAGFKFFKKVSDRVKKGDAILEIHCSSKNKLGKAEKRILKCISFSKTKPRKPRLIYKVIK